MVKNGQTYYKNLAVFTPQDFYSMFGHFSTLFMKGLMFQIPSDWDLTPRFLMLRLNFFFTKLSKFDIYYKSFFTGLIDIVED